MNNWIKYHILLPDHNLKTNTEAYTKWLTLACISSFSCCLLETFSARTSSRFSYSFNKTNSSNSVTWRRSAFFIVTSSRNLSCRNNLNSASKFFTISSILPSSLSCSYVNLQSNKNMFFVCVEVLRPCQQLRSCRDGQLPINTVPGQA